MYLLVVNYHYVHEEGRYPYPGIYPTPVARLRAQLEEIGRSFEFVDQDLLVRAVQGESDLPERSCLVTFDDGLRCQYENALPVLDELDIPALFFANGLPYAEGRACGVHKLHYCRASISPALFLRKLTSLYGTLTGQVLDLGSLDTARVRRQKLYDDEAEARLKFFLNHVLDDATRTRVLDGLLRDVVDDERSWCEQFYLSAQQLDELRTRSSLGIHGYSHVPLVSLAPDDVKHQLAANIQALEAVTGRVGWVRSVSYPYGSVEAVSLRDSRIAASEGLVAGFTMERAVNRSLTEPLLLARMDTNDVMGGKSPLLAVHGNDLFAAPPARLHRSDFFAERPSIKA